MKIKSLLFLLVLVSFLAGCGTQGAKQTTVGGAQDSAMLVQHQYFYTMEDYNSFMKSTVLPENFICYEQIKEIGQYKSYKTRLGELAGIGFNSYSLTDNEGFEIIFLISVPGLEHFSTGDWDDLPADSVKHDDMRRTSGSGIYHYDGISYLYAVDQLSTVFWTYNDTIFEFTIEDFHEYPLGADTFAAKLLNVETAREAIDDLMASCFPE